MLWLLVGVAIAQECSDEFDSSLCGTSITRPSTRQSSYCTKDETQPKPQFCIDHMDPGGKCWPQTLWTDRCRFLEEECGFARLKCVNGLKCGESTDAKIIALTCRPEEEVEEEASFLTEHHEYIKEVTDFHEECDPPQYPETSNEGGFHVLRIFNGFNGLCNQPKNEKRELYEQQVEFFVNLAKKNGYNVTIRGVDISKEWSDSTQYQHVVWADIIIVETFWAYPDLLEDTIFIHPEGKLGLGVLTIALTSANEFPVYENEFAVSQEYDVRFSPIYRAISLIHGSDLTYAMIRHKGSDYCPFPTGYTYNAVYDIDIREVDFDILHDVDVLEICSYEDDLITKIIREIKSREIEILWKLIGGTVLSHKDVQESCPFCIMSSRGFCTDETSYVSQEQTLRMLFFDPIRKLPPKYDAFWKTLSEDYQPFNMTGTVSLTHAHYIMMRALRLNVTLLEAAKMGGLKPITGAIANFSYECSGILQSRYGNLEVFYPGDKAEFYILLPSPTWEDQECYPDCPPCFNGICETLTKYLLYSIIIIAALIVVFSLLRYFYFEDTYLIDEFSGVGYFMYAILEIIAATIGVWSIWAIRSSADNNSILFNIIITIWAVTDGIGATLKVTEVIAEYLEFEVCWANSSTTINTVFMIVNMVGIVLLVLSMSNSSNPTASTMPVLLDVMINLLEVFLVLLSRELKDALRATEDAMVESVRGARN